VSVHALLKGWLAQPKKKVMQGSAQSALATDDTTAGDTSYECGFYIRLVSAIRGLNLRVIPISNPDMGQSVFQYYTNASI
jgi:hypothetical protein